MSQELIDEIKLNQAKVYKVTEDYVMMWVPVNACTPNHLQAAPASVEFHGVHFSKRSYVFDGILYHSGNEPTFVGRETLQRAVGGWTRSVFTTAVPVSVAERVVQEGQELIEACKLWPPVYEDYTKLGYRTAADVADAIGAEVADVVHCLIDLCELVGIDLDKATRKKLEINKARKWGEPDENNQRRHIEKAPAELGEFGTTNADNVPTRTSKDWLAMNPHIIVLDPDGWDRKNFEHSFNVELITKEEFTNRLNVSTTNLGKPI
jgi:hypothetical protein